MPETTQLDRIEVRLTHIGQLLNELVSLTRTGLTEILTMATSLGNLTIQVANLETVDQSAVALIQGLAQEIAALQPDQAEIDNLAARVAASATALAAAVTANTPAAPPAAPTSGNGSDHPAG